MSSPYRATASALEVAALVAADRAELADRQRRLSEETVTAVTGAGLPAHFVPRRLGGAEGSFTDLLARTATLAEACPSAAWCGALWAVHGRYAGNLPEQGRQELWRGSADVRIAAALAPPAGSAAPEADGWRVSGTWRCVSGIEDSHWVLLAAPTTTGSGVQVLAVPRADLAVVDSWNSSGMRGTGSHTVVADDLAVPAHRAFPLTDLLQGRRHGPAHLTGGLVFCATALGAARRAVRLCSAPVSAAHRETLATAAGHVDAAELLLTRAARRADTETATALLTATNQRDAAVAADLLVGAVERLYRTAGTRMSAADTELQRLWRDVHTVTTHRVLRLDLASEAYAAALS